MVQPLRVTQIEHRAAAKIVVAHHYLHRKPSISYAYGLHAGDQLVGVVTFGTPASRHMQIGACPSDPSAVIELNRLWVSDAMPPNTESWFVSRALRQLPARIVVSYADTTYGHVGYVYRALSFHYAGWTDMERRLPRLDYLPAKDGLHTREAFRSGVRTTVRRQPKVKYWTTTGTPAQRRALRARCGWPSLDWHEHPPPTEGHRQLLLPKDG